MKDWTVMVYMAGDNNLSEDMITGLKGLKAVAGKGNINIVALYDSNYPAVPVKIYDFSKNIKKSRLEDYVIKSGSSPALDENFRIEDFIEMVLNNYKAKKYALIFSGHGDGVIGRTLLRDENPDTVLDLKDLAKLLERLQPKDKNGKKRKFDLLGFDSCLMNMLEVGYEFKDAAKVLVASEGNIPCSGWEYDLILSDLISRKGSFDERDFGKSIVRQFTECNLDYAIGGRSVNIAACDLTNIDALYEAVQKFARHINALLDLPIKAGGGVTEEEAKMNKTIREKFIDWMLLSHYESQTFMHGQAVDIIDFIYNLLLRFRKSVLEHEHFGNISNSKLKSRIERKIDLIFDDFVKIDDAVNKGSDSFILASCFVGAEYQFSKGVSVFFPWTRMALNLIYTKYSKLKFNRKKNWLKLIDKFTALTMRKREKRLFHKSIGSLNDVEYSDLLHREIVGKEIVGREIVGREIVGREIVGKGNLSSFYIYFSQVRNYDTDYLSSDCVDDSSFT